MFSFSAKVNSNSKWHPQIEFNCPICGVKNGFYSTLAFNECKHCFKVIGRTSIASMAKSTLGRIQYHVRGDAGE